MPSTKSTPSKAVPPKHIKKLRKFDIIDGTVHEVNEDTAAIWIYTNPDDSQKRQLVNDLKIDEHTLNSALDPDEQSRLEFEPEHIALILKRPKNYSQQDQFMFKVTSIGFFFFKSKLIVVSADEENISILNGRPAKITSLHHLLLKFISRIINHYFEHLKTINKISDELEQQINGSLENKYLLNLFTLEKSLVYYLNAIHANSVVIVKLKYNAVRIGFSLENLEYLEDLIIENNQCYTQSEIYSSILASLMDARASIVSNNLNVLMKTLNVITIAIMVPTFVVSAFSMNVKLPFELSEWQLAFWLIMGMAAISVISFMIFWKIKRW